MSYNSNVFVILVLAAIDCLFQCELRLLVLSVLSNFGLCSGYFEYYRALGLIEILWRMLIFLFQWVIDMVGFRLQILIILLDLGLPSVQARRY